MYIKILIFCTHQILENIFQENILRQNKRSPKELLWGLMMSYIWQNPKSPLFLEVKIEYS